MFQAEVPGGGGVAARALRGEAGAQGSPNGVSSRAGVTVRVFPSEVRACPFQEGTGLSVTSSVN